MGREGARVGAQGALLAGDLTAGAGDALIDAKPWDLRQKLMEEKAALGFTLSGHLFSVYERDIAASREADRKQGQLVSFENEADVAIFNAKFEP